MGAAAAKPAGEPPAASAEPAAAESPFLEIADPGDGGAAGFSDPEAPLLSDESARPRRHRALGLLPLVALIFYEVSGGPFGIEVRCVRLSSPGSKWPASPSAPGPLLLSLCNTRQQLLPFWLQTAPPPPQTTHTPHPNRQPKPLILNLHRVVSSPARPLHS